MYQLHFNDKFDGIEEEIHYWEKRKDIPNNVIEFISNTINSNVIFDEKTTEYYCPKCFSNVSSKLYCEKCNKKYDKKNKVVFFDIHDNYEIKDYSFYVFDVIDNEVLLYLIGVKMHINSKYYSLIPVLEIYIDEVYLIKKDYLYDLKNKKYYLYNDVFNESKITLNYEEDKIENTDNYDYFVNGPYEAYLYIDNLELLKNTLYKYSFIWDNLALKSKRLNLYKLVYLPLYFRNYEYLVKYKLYNLTNFADELEYKGNFENTFGISKDYLKFMIKNNITYHELEILRMIKVKNIKILKELKDYSYVLKDLYNDFKIDILKIKKYFNSNNYRYDYLWEYYDYLKMAKDIGFNLKDKRVLFSKNLINKHNELLLDYKLKEDESINERIIEISKKLMNKSYEDNNYVIRPFESLESLFKESSEQNNCVRTYAESYANKECELYYLRDKLNIDKSLVTIEVRDNLVVQARIKNNKLPSKKLMNVINKWESIINKK